jgi:hypothetical protein
MNIIYSIKWSYIMGGYVYAEHFRHGSALYRDFLIHDSSVLHLQSIFWKIIHTLTPVFIKKHI